MPDLEQMRIRQRVLADFGDFVLHSDRLDEVLHEACRLVSDGLGTDFAKVLEIEAGGKSALVKAGVGWNPGVVGQEHLPFSEHSSETYSLERRTPVVSRDIKTEDRFEFASFLIDHGVAALVNVPILLPGGCPYGLLQVDSRETREFGDKDIEFLRTYATILGPVIDRLHKTQSLEQALEANERLLQELQHRVKNHIGIIVGMVRARARHTKSDDAREELIGVGERIETLRLVHEQLYQSGASGQLQLRPFLSRLVEGLCKLHGDDAGGINLKLEIANVPLAAEVAVPVGLITNEFVTNSLKHAFDDKGGTISVFVEEIEGRLKLCLSDDGKRPSASPPVVANGSGTGINLIEGLARQLGAEPSWPTLEAGTMLCLELEQPQA